MPYAVMDAGLDVQMRQRSREVRELDAARTMQRALLPRLSSSAGCDIAAFWRPAGALGGDGYDVLRLSDTRLALSIADVSGKGLPAALLLAHVQATARAYGPLAAGPDDLAGRVNRALCGNAALATFVSSCHAVLDLAAGTLVYANAGHLPPLVIRADGTVLRLTAGGPVLGVIPDAAYAQESVTLQCGDRLLFYTDGVTEAQSAGGLEFGEDRLITCAIAHRRAPAERLLEAIFGDVRSHSGGLDDDVAMLAVALC